MRQRGIVSPWRPSTDRASAQLLQEHSALKTERWQIAQSAGRRAHGSRRAAGEERWRKSVERSGVKALSAMLEAKLILTSYVGVSRETDKESHDLP